MFTVAIVLNFNGHFPAAVGAVFHTNLLFVTDSHILSIAKQNMRTNSR